MSLKCWGPIYATGIQRSHTRINFQLVDNRFVQTHTSVKENAGTYVVNADKVSEVHPTFCIIYLVKVNI